MPSQFDALTLMYFMLPLWLAAGVVDWLGYAPPPSEDLKREEIAAASDDDRRDRRVGTGALVQTTVH